jgi:DNA-directed RNA polymerase specialized sigma subunit
MNKDELILNNTNLIYRVLQKMNLYDQREYYYEIGLLGLIKAAYNFDSSKRMCI